MNWVRIEQLIVRLEDELSIDERVSISGELFGLTGERFGSDHGAWCAWRARQKTPARDGDAEQPERAPRTPMRQEPAFLQMCELGLVNPDNLGLRYKEHLAGETFEEKVEDLLNEARNMRAVILEARRSEIGSGLAHTLAELTDDEVELPYRVWRKSRGPLRFRLGDEEVVLERNFQRGVTDLLLRWCTGKADGQRIYLHHDDSVDWWTAWVLSDEQAVFLTRHALPGLLPAEEARESLDCRHARGREGRICDALGSEHVLVLDSECVECADDYVGIVDGMADLCDGALDEVEVDCVEADGAAGGEEHRLLTLAADWGTLEARLRGRTDYLDMDPLLGCLNGWLEQRGSAGRLYSFRDRSFGQEVGVAWATAEQAGKLRLQKPKG